CLGRGIVVLLYGCGEFFIPAILYATTCSSVRSSMLNGGGVTMNGQPLQVTCAIAGGGPAGVMLGFLLARAGVKVAVLEKHRDFLRDFRGDTIHPSTLQVMHELGLLDALLKRPHQEIRQLHGIVGDTDITLGDF